MDKYGGAILWLAVALYMVKVLSTVCDEYWMPALESMIDRLRISPDVASVTFLAVGSGILRLLVSSSATLLIENSSGVGAIIGSAIFNLLVIVGATGLVSCKDGVSLVIWWYSLVRDTAFYALAIVELAIVLADEEVRWYEALIMLVTYAGYCFYMALNVRITTRLGLHKDLTKVLAEAAAASGRRGDTGQETFHSPQQDFSSTTDEFVAGTVGPRTAGFAEPSPTADMDRQEFEDGDGNQEALQSFQGASEQTERDGCDWLQEAQSATAQIVKSTTPAQLLRDPVDTCLEALMPLPENRCGLLACLSLAFIMVCTYLLTDASVRAGCVLRISAQVIGLALFGASASVPDLIYSTTLARQGEGDMAIANVASSGLFDILVGLGLPWLLRSMTGNSVNFTGEVASLKWDIIILACILVVLVLGLVINGWRFSLRASQLLVAGYAVYCLYLFISIFTFRAMQPDIVEVDPGL